MLKKTNRLVSFTREPGAETYSSPFLTISATQTTEDSKFGFIISKKIDKRAVVRNRLKRQMSKFVEERLSRIDPRIKVVIVAKKQILEKESEIHKLLEEGFLKLKLLK